MSALRPPAGTPIASTQRRELEPGYGVCEAKGHHGVAWIKYPKRRVNGVLYGRCAAEKCGGSR